MQCSKRTTVIGNQSAGKSSVVEAISGITVPRDAGTCTRCPMECRLAYTATEKWSCSIYIRREYDASGNVLDKVTETTFGAVITKKEDVELALRRAQVTVLNPHLDPLTILNASVEELTQSPFVSKRTSPFSRDTICIELEGPELTDLSFVDLPGLIQNDEPETIKLVEEMVVSHIRGNCLILVALPMTDDIENQKALRLARQEDPDGMRTIGVMTKPDMLTSGSTKAREIWLDVIEGRRHPLVHGYYCTRQPDDVERADNITPETARAAEAKFFSSTTPWSTSKYENRFGTDHLISSLSKLLVGIINDTLPRIMAEAASKLEHCNQELAALPREIEGDPANYMLKLLTSFCDDIHRPVHNGLDVNQLVHLNTETFKELKIAIRKSAPNFIPEVFHNDTGTSSASSVKVDKLAEGPPFYLNDMLKHIQSSITRELPNNVPFSAKIDLIPKFQASWESAVETCFTAVRKHVQDMLEHQIRHTFHRYEHLEGHVRIFVSEIVQRHFETCNTIIGPVLQAEATPLTQNTHYLADLTAKWSSTYKAKRSDTDEQNGLPPFKKQRTNGHISASAPKTVFPSTDTFIPPSNNSIPSTSGSATSFVNSMSDDPSGAFFFRVPPQQPSEVPNPFTTTSKKTSEDEQKRHINNALAALAALGYRGITEADFGKMIPPDEYETEIQVMAEIRGYFQITYKRVIDTIPSLIDLLFVRAIADDMQPSLITQFSLGTVDAKERCAMYLAENPMVVVKRKELTVRKERLEEVKHALHAFGLST
ncbi:hypothetical protein H2248_002929 [Termitomyces sp. 'cryptogamus']|nr:hypothetical protein H2248_002929 [Termitomyces sp. 'cryptogamus']